MISCQSYDAGETVYVIFRNDAGKVWSTTGTPAYETYATARYANYWTVADEQGTASGMYEVAVPAKVAAGNFTSEWKVRLGGVGAEAEIDPTIAVQVYYVLDSSGVRSALGLASANMDTQLAAIAAGNTGTGAFVVTLTVNDGSSIIQGATVRMTKGAESRNGTTNASGVVVFSLDAGTWTVSMTAAVYTFTPTTLVVSANTTHTYSMTAIVILASDLGFVTGYIYCYAEDGQPKSGVLVQMKFSGLPGTGHSHDQAVRTVTSDATGLATFPNLVPGATYHARRGTETDWVDIEIAADAESPVALGNLFGEDD